MTPKEIQNKYMGDGFALKVDFKKSDAAREDTLERCERYSGWTLPNIFPDDPLMESDEMQNDYQSVGAQAVTNLANKIMLALFQPSRPFFRMQLDENQRAEITEASGLQGAKIDAALAKAERNAMKELDKVNARVAMTQVVQQLIVTGNSLLYMPKGKKMQVYSLRDYVIKRGVDGGTIKIILRDTKSVSGLPDHLHAIAMEQGYDHEADVSLYTCILRVSEGKFLVWQELEDIAYAQDQVGHVDEDDLEHIPLTWNLARNKDYGTGLVENYAGDFWTMSTLAEAILDFTVLATDVKNLVNPAGMTDVRELTESKSGSYLHGREEDIFVHAPQVSNASAFLTEQFSAVERRIGRAFLLTASVTRDAERVTAEEIRMQAQELEASLGGVYSNLATELQLPLAKRLLAKLNPIFKNIEPVIVTGLESLSRSSELDRIRYFFQDFAQMAELPEQVMIRVDFGKLIAVLGSSHGVDYEKFLKDEKTVEKEQKARMEANAKAAGMEAGAVAQAEGQQPQ
tara:strand:+ start:2111 stop:3652 length:1542 start_codon:yes stop_codon:yes gene_type:complete